MAASSEARQIATSSDSCAEPKTHWRFNALCPGELPPEILERLRSRFRANAQRNLAFIGELLKILDPLAGRGIEAIPLK